MDYAKFIVAKDEALNKRLEPDMVSQINEKYEIWYYAYDRLPPFSISQYSYPAIPKCFATLNNDALLESGILNLQNITTLSLTGQGVFVAIIDTGVQINPDYNIFSIWDQTKDGNPPEGFFYGTEYTKENIKEGVESDEDGHGTYLASVIAGKKDIQNDFTGAAPDSQLIVVKLKPAEKELKDFYFIPDSQTVYSEADIMLGILYAHSLAIKQNRALVICLALGANNGPHLGSSPLSDYISELAAYRHRAVVVAAGNEANQRKHYRGNAKSVLTPARVEINVDKDIRGFYLEFWGFSPERFAVSVQSPSGAVRPLMVPVSRVNTTYDFPIEDARLTIDYRDTGRSRRDELIYVRIENAVSGIWNLLVYPESVIQGDFDIWLPMRKMLYDDVYFISPNPDTTLTMPGDSKTAMTVGAYNQITNSLYIDSGRGYEPDGWIKPDFLSPGVMIKGKDLRGQYVYYSGTSAACAITAGACAQLLEWAVVRENAIGINSVDIKNLLIRGAKRRDDVSYPAKEYGYGLMDVYKSFRLI